VNLTTGAGAVTARYQYDAWGNKRSESGSSFNRFGFTGHEKDEETGLYYAKARYYDPDTGRFLNQDPFEGLIDTPPSLHKYLYAYGNPTSYVDPDGKIVWFAVIAYVAYSGGTAAVDTAVEAGIDAGVSAATGQQSEFNAGESFAINFGINLVTGGTAGKAKNTYKAVKAADKILDARQAVKAADKAQEARQASKAADTVQDARQANYSAKSKSETKLTRESASEPSAKKSDSSFGDDSVGAARVKGSKVETEPQIRERLKTKYGRDDLNKDINRGEGYKKVDQSSDVPKKGDHYIPDQPLAKQRVNGQDIPLPLKEAEGRAHTALGSRVGSDGNVYRQSAEFPGNTWPKANGNDVPWSEVHWTNHGRGDHLNPHQHPFIFDGKGWIRQGGNGLPFNQ
jgi:RHS repeat-associated protein